MKKKTLSPFGIQVKIKLLELNQTQKWLIDNLNKEKIMYIDSSNLYKVMTGDLKKSKLEILIKEFLMINDNQSIHNANT